MASIADALERQHDLGAGVPNLGPSSIGPTDLEAVVEAEAKRRRYDPLQDSIDGGRVTETERRVVLRELTDLVG